MSDTLTHIGHASDTCPIVDQIVSQKIWIRFGHGGDTTETRLGHDGHILWAFFFFGLKKP